MAPLHGAEGLCGNPTLQKSLMCLIEKIRVLGKVCSGMTSSAAGHEVYVSESMI